MDVRYSTGTLAERHYADKRPHIFRTWSHGANIRVGYLTSGDKFWQAYFGNPEYGLDLSYNTYTNSMYGHNIGLNPYFRAPILRSGNFSLNYSAGLGIAWHSKRWDPVTNPLNMYISSRFTTIIDLAISGRYYISDHYNIFAGVGFTHYSNGAIKYPNKGINAFAVFVGAGYGQRYTRHRGLAYAMPPRPDIEYKNEIYTSFAPSFVNRPVTENRQIKTLFCSTWELGYKRKFHPCFKWGAGIDITYTGTEKYEFPEDERSNWQNLSLTTFGSIEMIMGAISIHAAAGVSPLYSAKPRGIFSQRIGVFYNFGSNFRQFAGVSIKATKGQADFIEWTYGFRIKSF